MTIYEVFDIPQSFLFYLGRVYGLAPQDLPSETVAFQLTTLLDELYILVNNPVDSFAHHLYFRTAFGNNAVLTKELYQLLELTMSDLLHMATETLIYGDVTYNVDMNDRVIKFRMEMI